MGSPLSWAPSHPNSYLHGLFLSLILDLNISQAGRDQTPTRPQTSPFLRWAQGCPRWVRGSKPPSLRGSCEEEWPHFSGCPGLASTWRLRAAWHPGPAGRPGGAALLPPCASHPLGLVGAESGQGPQHRLRVQTARAPLMPRAGFTHKLGPHPLFLFCPHLNLWPLPPG